MLKRVEVHPVPVVDSGNLMDLSLPFNCCRVETHLDSVSIGFDAIVDGLANSRGEVVSRVSERLKCAAREDASNRREMGLPQHVGARPRARVGLAKYCEVCLSQSRPMLTAPQPGRLEAAGPSVDA